MPNITSWNEFAIRIRRAGAAIAGSAKLVGPKGVVDQRFLALTLLARTMSNISAALILLRERYIVEARTITRSCVENQFWAVGLAKEGDAFVRKMLHDEMNRKIARGQALFDPALDLDQEVKNKLQEWMRVANKQFANAKSLNPKTVAEITEIGKTYIFYAALSSDAAHPSIDALNRYVVTDAANQITGLNFKPPVTADEVVDTLIMLTMSSLSVCVAVNQTLGAGNEEELGRLSADYTELLNSPASE